MSSFWNWMSLSGVCQGAFRAYISLLKVSSSKRKAENWEAGQIPALPPQRWWSESLGKKPLDGSVREGAGLVRKGRLLSPETSLDGHNRNGLRRAAGSEPETHGRAPVRGSCPASPKHGA